MSYKLDFRDIVKNHIKTLVNDNTNKPDVRDIFFFVIIPILIPSLLCYNKIFIKEEFIGSIISGLAILIGLALNLIVVIFEIAQKKENSKFNDDFILELIANIAFIVITSLLTIIISITTIVKLDIIKYISNFITYFLTIELILAIIVLIINMYHEMKYIIDKKNQ